MQYPSRLLGLVLALTPLGAVGAGCDPDETGPAPLAPEPGEELSGGDTTVFDTTREAFARAARNLDAEGREEFALGDHFFNRNWITAPASSEGGDGLGPHYNATSCSACHFKDGRGSPPEEPDEEFFALLFRLSVPGVGEHGEPLPEPVYGGQLQNFGILGIPPEGKPAVTYETIVVAYLDGATEELRQPQYSFNELAYGAFARGTMISPRIARQLIGLGLLAAIDEQTVVANADPDDTDGDGISGRPNYVWDSVSQQKMLGRFGWKAAEATLLSQNARASVEDIGVTSRVFRDETCSESQTDCLAMPTGGDPELDDSKLDRVTFYMHTVAVPGRRDVADPEVLQGRELFKDAGCASCHMPLMKTGELADYPMLSNQIIRPYTDLLLHDMGANLADDRPDHEADGREWRTPPLWGIGLIETVNKHNFLLHDGRARGFAEAILWHGGEAFDAREAFRGMSAQERAALLRFLSSL